jgi:hypothetical protein
MQIMLYLLTNLARVLLFAFYLFFTYKCLLRPPEKVATSQRAAYSQFIAATRRQFRRAPNAHVGAAALDQLGQPASREEKVCADAFWGYGSLT